MPRGLGDAPLTSDERAYARRVLAELEADPAPDEHVRRDIRNLRERLTGTVAEPRRHVAIEGR